MVTSKLINVRVSAKLQKELQKFSRSEHVPISELVRDSLREFLAIRKFRRLSKEVRGLARKVGFVNQSQVVSLAGMWKGHKKTTSIHAFINKLRAPCYRRGNVESYRRKTN